MKNARMTSVDVTGTIENVQHIFSVFVLLTLNVSYPGTEAYLGPCLRCLYDDVF